METYDLPILNESASPIQRLSDDTFLEIFSWCCICSKNVFHPDTSPATLAGVCVYWRKLIYEFPSLWASLKVTRRISSVGLEQWLTRAGKHMITADVRGGMHNSRPLLSRKKQWHTISIHCMDSLMIGFLSGYCPELRKLALSCLVQSPLDINRLNAPKLTSLSLEGFLHEITPRTLRNLTEIRIHRHINLNATILSSRYLSDCVNLQHLAIELPETFADHEPHSSLVGRVPLPKLASITLVDAAKCLALDRFETPMLSKLSMACSSSTRPCFFSQPYMLHFLSQTSHSLTTLVLKYVQGSKPNLAIIPQLLMALPELKVVDITDHTADNVIILALLEGLVQTTFVPVLEELRLVCSKFKHPKMLLDRLEARQKSGSNRLRELQGELPGIPYTVANKVKWSDRLRQLEEGGLVLAIRYGNTRLDRVWALADSRGSRPM